MIGTKNNYQESWRIYQDVYRFSDNSLSRIIRINRADYPHNLQDNIAEIDETPYNIYWKGQHSVIVNNNRKRINVLPPTDESAKTAITGYLIYLVREGGVE